MNKLFTILMSMFLMITCSDKSPVGPSEPEKVGCDAATFYDWDNLNYSDNFLSLQDLKTLQNKR